MCYFISLPTFFFHCHLLVVAFTIHPNIAQLVLIVFNCTSYVIWFVQFMITLRSHGLMGYIDGWNPKLHTFLFIKQGTQYPSLILSLLPSNRTNYSIVRLVSSYPQISCGYEYAIVALLEAWYNLLWPKHCI